MKKGQTSKRGGYQDLLCPFTTVYVTQWSNTTPTHKGTKAYDVRGNKPGIRYPYYAPCDVKCVATVPSYGEALWQSVNKVRFANGKIDYYTFTTVHDNTFNVKPGSKVYKQGTQIGNMGTKGYATGVHCHIEGCYGKYTKLTKNKYGFYIVGPSYENEVLPRDTFFMDGTIIKKWYKPKYLKDVKVATYKTTTADLNMRNKASLSGKIILVIPKGKKVEYLGSAGTSNGYTWSKVKYNGKTGYVASKYLK